LVPLAPIKGRTSYLRRSASAFALALLASFSLGETSSFALANGAQQGGVWVDDGTAIKRIDTDTNAFVQTIELAFAPDAVAVDARSGAVWALSGKKLYRFESNGQPAAQIDLLKVDQQVDSPRRLIVDPYSGAVTVVGERLVLQISELGAKSFAWKSLNRLRDVALDIDGAIWVLDDQTLTKLSAQGQIVAQRIIAAELPAPRLLAIDNLRSRAWALGNKIAIRLSTTDLNKNDPIVLDLSAANADPSSNDTESLNAIAVDPVLGRVWVLSKDRLLSIDPANDRIDRNVALADVGLTGAQALIFDTRSQSLWVAGRDFVARLSSSGDVQSASTLAKGGGHLASAPFQLLPTLEIVSPIANGVTRNNRPPIVLKLGASCNSVVCELPPAYTESFSLDVLLNGVQIGSAFQISSQDAVYQPSASLNEGANTLVAGARDLFGHVAPSQSLSFVVDTIPPKFLGVTPADGSTVGSNAVTITGSVDDATASVSLLNANGAVVSHGGAQFAFAVTLNQGLNVFTLLARDPAGNETSMPLRLTVGGLSIRILSPNNGASFPYDSVLVRGTFDATGQVGIVVNETRATWTGNEFFAAVKVKPGSNRITATLFAEGAQASDSIDVTGTVTPTGQFTVSVDMRNYIAPALALFNVQAPSGLSIASYTIDYDGDGVVDETRTGANVTFGKVYLASGIYPVTVTGYTTSNEAIQQVILLPLMTAQQADTLFSAIWDGMNAALVRGDLPAALTYLNPTGQRKYGPIFEALLPHMSEIVASYSPIARVSLKESIAEYAFVTQTNGRSKVFFVYFIKDGQGIWRLDSM